MSDRSDDPAGPGSPGGGFNGGTARDPLGFGAPSGFLRGGAVLVVGVVLGALLMPSAHAGARST